MSLTPPNSNPGHSAMLFLSWAFPASSVILAVKESTTHRERLAGLENFSTPVLIILLTLFSAIYARKKASNQDYRLSPDDRSFAFRSDMSFALAIASIGAAAAINLVLPYSAALGWILVGLTLVVQILIIRPLILASFRSQKS